MPITYFSPIAFALALIASHLHAASTTLNNYSSKAPYNSTTLNNYSSKAPNKRKQPAIFTMDCRTEQVDNLETLKKRLHTAEEALRKSKFDQTKNSFNREAACQTDVAIALQMLYRPHEALSYLEETLRICQKHKQNNLVPVALAGAHLANLLIELGEYQKAEKHLNNSLTIFNKDDPHDAQTNRVREMLIKALQGQKKYDSALKYLSTQKKSIALNRDAMSPIKIMAKANMGELYSNQGNHKEAKKVVEEALNSAKNRLGSSHVTIGRVYVKLGNALYKARKYSDAKHQYTKAQSIFKKQCGEGHFQMAILQGKFADISTALGEYKDAKVHLNAALKIQVKWLGKNHLTIASTQVKLGNVCRELKEYKKAKKYLMEALEIEKKTSRKNSLKIAKMKTILGKICRDLGEYKKAKKYLLEASEVQQYLPNAADTMATLSNVCRELHKDKEAEKYLEKSRALVTSHYFEDPKPSEIDKKRYNKLLAEKKGWVKEDLKVASKLEELARLTRRMALTLGAKNYFMKAIAIRERHGGKDSTIAIGRTKLELGRLLIELGRYEVAKTYLTSSKDIFMKYLGESNQLTLLAMEWLGKALQKQGKYGRAQGRFRKVYAKRFTERGATDFMTAIADDSMGNLLSDRSMDGAIPLLESALKIMTEKFGKRHFITAMVQVNLGNAFYEADDNLKAEANYKTAYSILKETCGDKHLLTAIAKGNLANIAALQGQYKKAKSDYDEVLKIELRYYAEQHPNIARTKGSLGNVCRNLGEYKDGITYLKQALIIYEMCLDKDHPKIAATKENIMIAYPEFIASLKKQYGKTHSKVYEQEIKFELFKKRIPLTT